MRTVATLPPAQLAPLAHVYTAAVAAKRRWMIGGIGLLIALSLLSGWAGQVDLAKFWKGLPRFASYFYDILPRLRMETFFADLREWFWNLDGWLALLWDTLLIAYLGTLSGAVAGFLLCFLASANLTRSTSLRFAARRTLEFCRTVPEIVFALIFVWAFGIGPLAGILAIIIHTAGANGKLFAEVAENADTHAMEGVRAAGGNWLQRMRFGVLPQVAPNFLSYTLLRFEINVRSASVLGFVGAGGIGEELYHVISFNYYEEISAILVLIILTVASIDMLSERLRRGLAAEAVRGAAG